MDLRCGSLPAPWWGLGAKRVPNALFIDAYGVWLRRHPVLQKEMVSSKVEKIQALQR